MASSDTPPLVVVISGGGPVGLTFAINLAMMMGKHVRIIIYEGRWFVDENGITRWQDEKQGKIRRDQVVTLQDHVIEQMPMYIQQGLFKNYNEKVWPTSKNIPIREVEDQLLALTEPFVRSGQVELIAEQLQEQTERLIKKDFDVLVGADGSNSFVRRYCNIQMISEGIEYACGVAYNIPEQVPRSEEPLHQALNCVLTIAQTRYLVNSSTSRRGYLNIRLIQSEYDELRQHLQEFQSRNEPLDLLDVNQCPNSSMIWTIIRQGLEFFKISPKYVFRVVPIEINVRHASIVVRELRFEIKDDEDDQLSTSRKQKQYKTVLAFLAGDAALNVHFWPGRGMNSGMKAAMSLARNIVRSCTSKTVPSTITVRTPLRFLDFLDYEGFMARLRAREQQGRSLRVLIDPIDQSIIDSFKYAPMGHCCVRYARKLVRKLQEMRQRLQERSDWPHQDRPILDEELQHVSNRVSPHAVAQLSLANPWPTREMAGTEVLVEDTFPFDQNNFLPLPEPTKKPLARTSSVIVRQHFLSLWIVGEPISEFIQKIINNIQNLPNVAIQSSAQPLLASSTLHNSSEQPLAQLVIVHTIDEAKQWITTNQESINQPGALFKVMTVWSLPNQMTAVDAILAIRAEKAYTPILIFTNNREEIRPALEFPNVTATDTIFELHEFIGANEETQWNVGCRVSHLKFEAMPEEDDEDEDQQQSETSITTNNISNYTDSSNGYYSDPTHHCELDEDVTSFLTPPSSSSENHYKNDPFLFWIDSPDNDAITTEQLLVTHPELEIRFTRTFHEARTYIQNNLKDIRHRRKFLVICRGQYADESKNAIDVVHLLKEFDLSVPLIVYTMDRTSLLRHIPNIPEHVLVFDQREDLLDFISENLNQ